MISASITDIWDLPAETNARASTSAPLPEDVGDSERSESANAPSREAKRPLFLTSDDEDERDRPSHKEHSTNSLNGDIDALFEGLDDFQDLAPTLDLDRVRREADARHAKSARAKFALNIPPQTQSGLSVSRNGKGKETISDGEEDGKSDNDGGRSKKKKQRAKLDETRLLGDSGFPQLLKETKDFKPLGKGYETKDLNRVMEIYRFWAHRMWPKDRFTDTVQRVEKLCHSRRLHVALSVWRDEAKGLVNGKQLPDESDINLTSDEEDENHEPTSRSSPSLSRSTLGAPTTALMPRHRVIDDGDHDRDTSSRHSLRASTLPPSTPTASSGSEDNFDNMDLDSILAHTTRATEADRYFEQRIPKPSAPAEADFDDDAMWEMLDDMQGQPPRSERVSKLSERGIDDDEDMWDAVREAEQEVQRPAASNKPPSAGTLEARRRAEEEDWESMYA